MDRKSGPKVNNLNDGQEHPKSSTSDAQRKDKKTNAATGASAAGVRAISARLIAFYFRAPAKAFFRTRVE